MTQQYRTTLESIEAQANRIWEIVNRQWCVLDMGDPAFEDMDAIKSGIEHIIATVEVAHFIGQSKSGDEGEVLS